MSSYLNNSRSNAFPQRKSSDKNNEPNKAAQLKQLEHNINNGLTQLFAMDEEDQSIQQKTEQKDELQQKNNPTNEGDSSKMPDDVKTKMESAFGTDFSDVKIHQNSDKATSLGAQAFTQGNHIYFAPGYYDPENQKGQKLLGHELTHVLQQKDGSVSPTQEKDNIPINDNALLEKEADNMGEKAAQGKAANVNGRASNILQLKGTGVGPIQPPNYTVQMTFAYVGGKLRINLNFTAEKKIGDFSGSYGFGVTYYSSYLNTGKSGFEMRNSFMLGYEDNKQRGGSLGTNIWTGLGEMSEFNQRTGFVNAHTKDFGFSYENDGTPFGTIGLGDGRDAYRTAAASIRIGELSLNTNLFTGLRDELSFFVEDNLLPGGTMGYPSTGQFGEKYTHGLVYERGPRYRYGGLTLNYQGRSVGIDSDRYVRHIFQNYLAHDIIKDQRQFEVLSNDINNVYNAYPFGLSKFTLWGE